MDIKSIFQKSFRYNASPLSLAYNVGSLFSELFGKKSDGKFLDTVSGIFNDMVVKTTGSALTGAEREQNAFNAGEALKQRNFEERLANTQYQRGVNDMTAAGLNPAALFGSGQPAPTPAGSAASAGGFSPSGLADLMALISLPAQLRNLDAQTDNLHANAGLTRQRTLTEEQLTALQAIAVNWAPQLNEKNIQVMDKSISKMSSEILEITSKVHLNQSQEQLIKSQKEAQAITNSYLPQRLVAEIDKMDAEARNSHASAWMTEIQAKFARDNGFLMSDNDMLLLGTYIASLFQVDKDSVETVISKASDYVKKEFGYDFRPWRKVSPEEAMAYYLEHHPDKRN